MRYYNIVRINDKTGSRVLMNAEPLTHQDALIMLGKMMDLSPWPNLRSIIEEVNP